MMDGKLAVETIKGKFAAVDRPIEIPLQKQGSFKAFMTDEVKAILRANLPQDSNDFVFKPRIHKHEMVLRVSGFFQRTADRLFNKGIEDRRQKVVFHSLRHTFGSWLAIQGTPILAIKELMGHKSLAMTERYAHLSPDMKKQAVSQLEENFKNGSANGNEGKRKNRNPL